MTIKRRPSPTWRKYEKAVAAEVERRLALRRITFRTLTIDFVNRTVDDGRRKITVETQMLSMPILDTEQILWPR